MPTPSGFPTSEDLQNAQKDVEHLGRVVNSEDAQGNPITSSTNRTGGTNKTLDALQSEYQSAIQAAGGVPLGTWSAGITISAYNEYLVYNGIPYKPAASTSLPYTTQGSDPTVAPDTGLVVPFAEVQASDLVTVREDLLGPGTKLYMGNDGESVKVGDTIPAGTTHLRVSAGGDSAILTMDSTAYGTVSEITASDAVIEGTNVGLFNSTELIFSGTKNGSAVDNMLLSPSTNQTKNALATKFKLKENGIPSSIYDYNTFNELHGESFGVIADYYLSDGSLNPNPTDNKIALKKLMRAATQYDDLNVLRKKVKSRILLPAGGVATSEPWIVVGGGTYADNGVAVGSVGYKTDIIKTEDGIGDAPVDSVIYLQQPNSPQSFACTNISLRDLRLISNNADYGVTSQNDVTFFDSESVNMELGKTGAQGYYFPEFFYVNWIVKGHLSCAGRALVMDRSGTTNFFDNIFAYGCQDGPFKIACVYSNIGTLAADNCAGTIYDLSFSSATTFGSLGSESPDATSIVRADLGSQVSIQSLYFQNAESMDGDVVYCGDGCSVEINKLNGYSTSEQIQNVTTLRLANVGNNARCIIKDYKGFYKFGKRDVVGGANSTLEVGSGDFGSKNNIIQREDGIHYLGQGRQEFSDWYNISPLTKPKTIFMNHGHNAITLNDGINVSFSGNGLTKGDLIPLDDPYNTGQAILIVRNAGNDFLSSEYDIIQATRVVQTLSDLPDSNLWTGRDVKVIDEKKTYTYYPASAGDPAGWYDYNGVKAP